MISWVFIGFIICTYFSWTNYHLAQKVDPGYITNTREQQSRVNHRREKHVNVLFSQGYYSIG